MVTAQMNWLVEIAAVPVAEAQSTVLQHPPRTLSTLAERITFSATTVIVFGSRGYATVNQIVLRAKTKKTVTVLMVERKAELAVDRRIIALNIAALCRWVAFPMPLSVTDTKTVPTIQTKKDVAD